MVVMGRSAYFPKGGLRMRADRYEALLDFLLEAASDDRTTPSPAHVLAGLRRLVRCETVSYREWNPEKRLEFSFAADQPEEIRQVRPTYPQVRHNDPIPSSSRHGNALPDRDGPQKPC
jgi:hypothetical protein